MPLAEPRGYIQAITAEGGRKLLRQVADDYPALREQVAATLEKSAVWFLLFISVNKQAIAKIDELFPQKAAAQMPTLPGLFNMALAMTSDPWPDEKLVNVAKAIGVMLYSPLFHGPFLPRRPGSYVRIMGKEELEGFFSVAEAAGPKRLSSATRASVLKLLSEATSEFYELVCSGLSAEQYEALRTTYGKDCYGYKMASGDWECWVFAPVAVKTHTDPFLRAYAKELAKSLGMELWHPGMGYHDSFAVSAPSRRPTPEAALEVKRDILDALKTSLPEVIAKAKWAGNAEVLDSSLFRLTAAIEQAEIVLWEPELWVAAISGCSVFASGVDAQFIRDTKPQLWMTTSRYDGEWGLPEDASVPADANLLALALVEVEGERVEREPLTGAPFTEAKRGAAFCLIFELPGEVPILRLLPPIFPEEPIPDYLTALVAAAHFMRLPLVRTEEVKPPHHVRRRAEREKRKLSKVHVIYLRRLRKEKKAQETEERSGEEREYNWQWLVGAHWRMQPYPSLGISKRIWIAPYFKGPIDKPFKPPGAKLYKVSR